MICISIHTIYNPFFGWAKFVDDFCVWNVLDIVRTSFEGIQNFKFQLFQKSLHPNSLVGKKIKPTFFICYVIWRYVQKRKNTDIQY